MENQLAVIKGFLDLINAAFRMRQPRSHPVKRHNTTKKKKNRSVASGIYNTADGIISSRQDAHH